MECFVIKCQVISFRGLEVISQRSLNAFHCILFENGLITIQLQSNMADIVSTHRNFLKFDCVHDFEIVNLLIKKHQISGART